MPHSSLTSSRCLALRFLRLEKLLVAHCLCGQRAYAAPPLATCHLPPDPQLAENIYTYEYISYIAHTLWPKVLVSLATLSGNAAAVAWGKRGTACVGRAEGEAGWMKRVFDSSSLAARCPEVRSLRLQFEFATSCTEHRESARWECEACGMRQVAGKTVKEIKYFGQPWLFNELNCSTNNIYLRPANPTYDIRNTIFWYDNLCS